MFSGNDANDWFHFFKWVGFVLTFLLLCSGVAAWHFRKADQKNRDDKRDAIQDRLAQEKEAEQKLKRTPPRVDPRLMIDKQSGEVYVLFQFQNMVPIKYRFHVSNEKNTVVGSIMMGMNEAHPKQEHQWFRTKYGNIEKLKIPKDHPSAVKLFFKYISLYAAEMGNSALGDEIEKWYIVDPINHTIVPR